MRLYVVRHGETDANKSGLALGRSDVELNETGRWQAERVAEALAREPVARVYSSPLKRAVATAEMIAGKHCLSVQIDDGLVEMDLAALDGMPFHEARERYPHYLDAWLGRRLPIASDPGGERLEQVTERAWLAIERIRERHHQGETVVAVTHNFVIQCLLCRVLGMDLEDFRRLRHHVTGITAFEFEDGRAILSSMNDTCHLRAV